MYAAGSRGPLRFKSNHGVSPYDVSSTLGGKEHSPHHEEASFVYVLISNAGHQSEHTNPQRLQCTEHAALVGGTVNSHALRIVPQPAAGRDVSMEETCQYCCIIAAALI